MRLNAMKVLPLLVVVLLLGTATAIWAQVVTATFYGIVRDQTDALIPGADVTLINEATGAERATITSDTGEFAFDFLSVGTYTLRIEMPGFKSSVTTGIALAAGQTVRETYAVEIGEVTEVVTVEGGTPLVSTASTEQRETLETVQVMELPVSRRNLTNILRLTVGLSVQTSRSETRGVRFAGIGKHGSGISVDGTDANANPEGRGLGTYQGRNYIDVMSIDAVEEIQIMRGILPADQGEVVGGQINIIAKSGTNAFHGRVFENYETHGLNAWSSPFATSRDDAGNKFDKPRTVFNQFGGSVGGPIIQDKAFFFFTYEGYRERRFRFVRDDYPTEEVRNAIREALPFTTTDLILASMPVPNTPSDEPGEGFFETAKGQTADENHFVAKGDWLVTPSSNFSVTYTRNNPVFLRPRADIGNDRTWSNEQDRLTFQYVTGTANWTSETRFGYNNIGQFRLDGIFEVKDPDKEEVTFAGRRLPYFRLNKRNPSTSVRFPKYARWNAPDGEIYQQSGDIYSLDQKVSRHMGAHSLKIGGRFSYTGGFRTNPETPRVRYRNLDDLLANKIDSVRPTFGNTLFDSRMYDFALFLHDTWRVSPKLTLNLGLRYNFYSNATVTADPSFGDDTCICTAEPPTDFRLFDFGPFRSEDKPIEHDGWVNLGPRLGFAYNPDGQGNTVIRGGFGVMFSPQMTAVLRQGVGDKVIPFRVTLERTEVEQLGTKWPFVWNDDLRPQVATLTEQSGLRFVSTFFDPELQNPYAMHYQLNVQRKLARDMMVEVGYAGTRGVKFILHRRFNQIDRITGERPNPSLIPSLYYVDNSQQTNYNALQLSVRKRFSSNYSFDAHYTWGKGLATQGLAGDIGAYYQGDNGFGIQDFFNLTLDRGPGAADVTQNFVADLIYEVPSTFDNSILRHVIGGWQVSGIVGARSGFPTRLTQSCPGNYHCRPDHVSGEPVVDNWRDNETSVGCRSNATCPVQYLNASAFAEVPESDVSGVPLRPGTSGISLFRTPGAWTVDFSLAKNFTLHEEVKLQWRIDMFNAFNHINYGGPRTNISSSRFGQIRGLSGPMRTMQMGLRLSF